MKHQCKDCVYFHSYRDCGEAGECHRYPPTANLNPVGLMYPRVRGDSWCGEQKPRECLGPPDVKIEISWEMLNIWHAMLFRAQAIVESFGNPDLIMVRGDLSGVIHQMETALND